MKNIIFILFLFSFSICFAQRGGVNDYGNNTSNSGTGTTKPKGTNSGYIYAQWYETCVTPVLAQNNAAAIRNKFVFSCSDSSVFFIDQNGIANKLSTPTTAVGGPIAFLKVLNNQPPFSIDSSIYRKNSITVGGRLSINNTDIIAVDSINDNTISILGNRNAYQTFERIFDGSSSIVGQSGNSLSNILGDGTTAFRVQSANNVVTNFPTNIEDLFAVNRNGDISFPDYITSRRDLEASTNYLATDATGKLISKAFTTAPVLSNQSVPFSNGTTLIESAGLRFVPAENGINLLGRLSLGDASQANIIRSNGIRVVQQNASYTTIFAPDNQAAVSFGNSTSDNTTYYNRNTHLFKNEIGTIYARVGTLGLEILQGNIRITTSNAATSPVFLLQNGVANVRQYVSNSTPESAILASRGDICAVSDGRIFVKTSNDGSNVGWEKVLTQKSGNALFAVSSQTVSTATPTDLVSITAGAAGVYSISYTISVYNVFTTGVNTAARFWLADTGNAPILDCATGWGCDQALSNTYSNCVTFTRIVTLTAGQVIKLRCAAATGTFSIENSGGAIGNSHFQLIKLAE